jgi:hypothetical protein
VRGVNGSSRPPAEPGARLSLWALLRGGPLARAARRADVRLYRLVRSAAKPPATRVVGRVYLGVHYPFDIAAGALLGMAMGSAAR